MFLHCDLIIIFFIQDGNTFCTTLNPRLFTMDLTIVEHKVFFTEVSLNNLFCGKISITAKGSNTLMPSFLQLVCQLLPHDKTDTNRLHFHRRGMLQKAMFYATCDTLNINGLGNE